jgi:Flp pilus assembly CpaF family ATPase
MQYKNFKNDTRVEHFYCDCGQVPLTGAKFRCKDADLHGYEEFIEFQSAELAHLLRYYGETNLLILGETGGGKSTWINAFANFITFSTLEEAIQVNMLHIKMEKKRFFIDKKGEINVSKYVYFCNLFLLIRKICRISGF